MYWDSAVTFTREEDVLIHSSCTLVRRSPRRGPPLRPQHSLVQKALEKLFGDWKNEARAPFVCFLSALDRISWSQDLNCVSKDGGVNLFFMQDCKKKYSQLKDSKVMSILMGLHFGEEGEEEEIHKGVTVRNTRSRKVWVFPKMCRLLKLWCERREVKAESRDAGSRPSGLFQKALLGNGVQATLSDPARVQHRATLFVFCKQ